jgi:ferrous iron transport protein B
MEKGKKDAGEEILSVANSLRWELGLGLHDTVIESVYADASRIARKTVQVKDEKAVDSFDKKVDRWVTNRWLGFPIMFLLLAFVFWITVIGANVPFRLAGGSAIGHPLYRLKRSGKLDKRPLVAVRSAH